MSRYESKSDWEKYVTWTNGAPIGCMTREQALAALNECLQVISDLDLAHGKWLNAQYCGKSQAEIGVARTKTFEVLHHIRHWMSEGGEWVPCDER